MFPAGAGWPISYGVNADIGAQVSINPLEGKFGAGGDNMNVYAPNGPLGAGGKGLPLNGKFDRVRNSSEVLLLADCGVRYNPGEPVPGTPLDRKDVLVFTTNWMTPGNSSLKDEDKGRLSGVAKTSWLNGRLPYKRHRDKINVAFCDGHGETVLKGDEQHVRVSPHKY
jgi:prepilin-type processing-associated H-X9-DG protein